MSKKRKQTYRPQIGDAGKSRKKSSGDGAETTRPQSSRKTASGPSFQPKTEPALVPIAPPRQWSVATWVMIAIAVALTVYSYLPTFVWISDNWRMEPDYGHGWFVIPLAIYLCVRRGDTFPGASADVSWAGLSLILLAIVMRVAGRFSYMDFLDAYSLLPGIAGAVWCLLGYRAMLWSLPAIGFLFFAIPLPFRFESALSWQLQGVATELSTFVLRALGQPAVAEAHIIWLGETNLAVEEACNGLRIFVGTTAFAYFWAVLNDRHWSDRVVLLAAAIPVAVFVNALRIVVIGLLYSVVSSESARHWIHDFSGYGMIFASFALLGLVGWYWQKVYKKVPIMTAKESLRGLAGHS